MNMHKTQVYPGVPIDTSQFSIEKDYKVTYSEEIGQKIREHQERMQNMQEWKSSDADLIHQYGRNF